MKCPATLILLVVSALPLYGQEAFDSLSRQYAIDQVTVTAYRSRTAVGGIVDGTLRLDMRQSRALPRLGGVVDPMRLLQLLPGVQTATDGDSGFYVRGGDAGQSAVELNNAPLYSYAHLFGFYSAFNPGHVRSFELDKSGLGAATGSSPGPVLRARTVEEIPLHARVEGEAGIIATQATAAVPLGRNRKGALYLSGRRSYAEWLVALLGASDDLKYAMQDYDATLVWDVSPDHKLVVNGHYGDDRLRAGFDQYLIGGKIRWHNSASSARLESRLSERFSLEQTLYLSDFASQLDLRTTGTSIATPSSLVDAGYKGSLVWRRGFCDLRAGFTYAFRTLRPQYLETDYNAVTTDRIIGKPVYHTHEAAPYVAANIAANERVDVGLSLRYAFYAMRRSGTGERYTDTSPEPGLSVGYRPALHHRLRVAYAYGARFMGLVPVSNVSFSTDFWMPATAAHPPMTSHNVTLGYQASLSDERLRLCVEAYYRRMYHVLEYDMPLMDLLHRTVEIERHIYSGDGEAYGVELIAAYSSRRFNGWVSYTLGRSVRRFAGLNDGLPFPAKQDRRHNFSLALTWSPTPRWDASAVFVYTSGAAYTSPTSYYTAGGMFVRGHGTYNGSRLPAYHRLDLSVTRWLGHGDDHRHGLNLSVYNCYSRKNPFYISWPIYFQEKTQELHTSRRKHYLYGILPSVSWIFRF